jgi:glycosyltransferase involved in cell wall biosynthesis
MACRAMIRITHVITGLNTGGAEMMLFKLLSRVDRNRFAPEVASLTSDGPVGERIRGLGIPVHAVGMVRGVPDPRGLLRLASYLRRSRPDLVQTWMYHADLIGGLAARAAGVRRLAWNIRGSDLDTSRTARGTILTVKLCARLSRPLPAAIVCCSEVARRVHADLGYDDRKITVLPNGFDVASLRPDAEARDDVRGELGIDLAAPLVGLIARFDPMKDHPNFIRAAGKVAARHGEVRFLLCGDGITPDNAELEREISAAGLAHRFHLLGRRSDIPRLNAALDVAVSSSRYGEGFPNVIGEAMACGVPCVVTDVGDSACVVGGTGRVVPKGDAPALASALGEILALAPGERAALGAAARRRVVENFEIGSVARRYEAFHAALAADRPAPLPIGAA